MEPEEFIKFIKDWNRYGYARSLSFRLEPPQGDLHLTLDTEGKILGNYTDDVVGAFDFETLTLAKEIKSWIKGALNALKNRQKFCAGFIIIDSSIWKDVPVDECIWQIGIQKLPTEIFFLTGFRINVHNKIRLLAELTGREVEVLRWISESKTNDEIAIILRIESATVRTHVQRILGKLGVENRHAAALIFWRATTHTLT